MRIWVLIGVVISHVMPHTGPIHVFHFNFEHRRDDLFTSEKKAPIFNGAVYLFILFIILTLAVSPS